MHFETAHCPLSLTCSEVDSASRFVLECLSVLKDTHETLRIIVFIVAPCILKIHLLSHTDKCTNYIIYYLKSVLIIDIKTLSYFHSSYVFRHITCHPQRALMFLAKITGKTICKTWTIIVWRVWQRICDMLLVTNYVTIRLYIFAITRTDSTSFTEWTVGFTLWYLTN
jgi:hypothetical protein